MKHTLFVDATGKDRTLHPTHFTPSNIKRLIAAAFVLLFSASLRSAVAAPPAPSSKPWSAMDRGPYFSASIESSLPTKAMTPKGLIIRVSQSPTAYVLFDTDLLRYSTAWVGDSINWHNVAFDGSHQTWSAVAGEELCGTPMIPGWAHAGSFQDPRTRYPSTDYRPQPEDWKNRAYGPLPHDWAQYKGLYLHGERTLLSYTVSNVAVLDSPSFEQSASLPLFIRTLNIAPSTSELILEVLNHPSTEGGITLDGQPDKLSASGTAVGSIAILGRPSATANANQSTTRPAIPSDGLLAAWTPTHNGTSLEPHEGKHAATMHGEPSPAGEHTNAIQLSAGRYAQIDDVERTDLSADFSIAAWVKTSAGGTILSKSSEGIWVSGGKTFFIENGNVVLDVGWVGAVRGGKSVRDGRWHHVAVTYRRNDGAVHLYVDGVPDAAGQLQSRPDPANCQIRLGFTSKNFPGGDGNQLDGAMGQVALYTRTLTPLEIAAIAGPRITPQRAVAAAVIGAPAGATWHVADQGHLRLHLPASSTPTQLKIITTRVNASDLPAFSAAVRASAPPENLSPLTHGGPPRWPRALVTHGKPATGTGAYVIDQITGPVDNPWKALLRFGGFDFFADGKRAALCTWDGDVWIVDGLSASLETLTWKRIATGLFQPLGLKIVPDAHGREQIYVCGRDQITRLHDLNNDDEVDFYECFNNDHQVTEHFHEFALGLQTDAEGNFYYTKSARHALDSVVPQHGTLLKVSKDGSRSEIICGGFRAANGFGLSEGGDMVVSDQEGFWTPADRINLLKPGGFYGNMWSAAGRSRKTADGYDPPLCWLPVKVDRSPAEELWVNSDQWGPLHGRMIHTSYGTGKVFLVLYESVNGVTQGGVVQMPGMAFNTGIMRARFHPTDGQLYVSGMTGWATNAVEPTGFYRIRYNHKPLCLPEALHVTSEGISLTFTTPLDKTASEDTEGYAVKQWQYRWSERYGSAHYSIENPTKEGQDDVNITAVTLSDDRRTILLHIPTIKPVMQMQIQLNIQDAGGNPVKLILHNTINQVPKTQ